MGRMRNIGTRLTTASSLLMSEDMEELLLSQSQVRPSTELVSLRLTPLVPVGSISPFPNMILKELLLVMMDSFTFNPEPMVRLTSEPEYLMSTQLAKIGSLLSILTMLQLRPLPLELSGHFKVTVTWL